jgi:hypothetical protein
MSAERDPVRRVGGRWQLTGILLTERMMDSPRPPSVLTDFWTSVYQAIDD